MKEKKKLDNIAPSDNLETTATEVKSAEEQITETNVTETPLIVTDDTVTQQVHYKQLSPAMMVTRRFFRSRLSIVGLAMLVFLFLFSFLGPVFMHWFGYKWGETTTDDSIKIVHAGEWVEYVDAQGNVLKRISTTTRK